MCRRVLSDEGAPCPPREWVTGRRPHTLRRSKLKRSPDQPHRETEAQGRAVFLPASGVSCTARASTSSPGSAVPALQASDHEDPVPPERRPLGVQASVRGCQGGPPPFTGVYLEPQAAQHASPSWISLRSYLFFGCVFLKILLSLGRRPCKDKTEEASFALPRPQLEKHGFDIRDACCPDPDLCLTPTLPTPRPHRWLPWEQS